MGPPQVADRGLRAENVDRHERLLNRILELNMKVWMDSTLSLDPEATAYYLIIAATTKTPNVLDHVENMRIARHQRALAGRSRRPMRRAIDVP